MSSCCRLTPKGSNGTGSGLPLGSLSSTKTQQPPEQHLPLVLVSEYGLEIRAGRVFSVTKTLLEEELIAPSDLSSAYTPLYNRHLMGLTRVATWLMILSQGSKCAELPQESVWHCSTIAAFVCCF